MADSGGTDAAAPARRRLTVKHTRTLRMTDDVLCVRISPNGVLSTFECEMLVDFVANPRNRLLRGGAT